ncbi:hypothetical protein NP493_1107g00001 [Ridgeia piscesae]|uniref:Uncharacterized protein n=1 Tax=Ridgeia piscesae TaxID=27915 RepID=A0AAD9NJQ4_RIDPI|nr:hypothetical protein NP493_1107g00001 [Ridgeia piscesae]
MLDVQQKAFQACLQSFVEANNKRVDKMVREHARYVADLRLSLQYTQRELDEMKMTIHSQSDGLSNTTRDVEQVTCAQREMEHGIDYVENQTRRNNLRIDGVAEIAAENWADAEAIVRKSFTTALKLPEAQANAIRIERAHRTGPSSTGRGSSRTRIETASCKPLARRNRVASS